MHGKTYNIKISTKSNINNEQFHEFDEWYDYELQRVEQERLLPQETKYQQLLKSKQKKILKEYYNKCFIPIRKKLNNEFVFFKYYIDDGKGDEEEQKEKEEGQVEEEEEEEEEEAAFPPHPSVCCGFTWETIEEWLKEGTLPSTLYNEIPREVYVVFRTSILEKQTRYLKRVDHLNSQQIQDSEEMLESFVPLHNLIKYSLFD
jgi:hypothetical protein